MSDITVTRGAVTSGAVMQQSGNNAKWRRGKGRTALEDFASMPELALTGGAMASAMPEHIVSTEQQRVAEGVCKKRGTSCKKWCVG